MAYRTAAADTKPAAIEIQARMVNQVGGMAQPLVTQYRYQLLWFGRALIDEGCREGESLQAFDWDGLA